MSGRSIPAHPIRSRVWGSPVVFQPRQYQRETPGERLLRAYALQAPVLVLHLSLPTYRISLRQALPWQRNGELAHVSGLAAHKKVEPPWIQFVRAKVAAKESEAERH